MSDITPINILLQIILKSYFFNSRCIFIFTEPIKKIEVPSELPSIYIVVHNNTLNPNLIFQHHGCQDIIINHENSTDLFVEMEKLIRLKNERFNKRKYVMVGRDKRDIFETKELQFISDLLLIIPETNYYHLITHTFSRNSNEPAVLDMWFPQNYSFLYRANLFPDKLRNQNGRRLKIGTFTYEPYSIIGGDNETFHGTETSLIFEFVRKYNLTPQFIIIENEWGDIFDNWTGIGLLGSLLDDVVDVGYAAVYTWDEYYKFIDYSKPLTRTGVSCLVPAPQLAPGWFTPLYSFSVEMWIALLVVLFSDVIVLSFMFYRLKNRHFVEDSVLIVLKLYLLQSLTLRMRGKTLKYFIALNMLSVLLISSAYSSGLSSVMTVPRYGRAIRTVKDLAESGLPWGAPSDAWLISLRQVTEPDYLTIKNQFVAKSEDDLITLSKLHNFGFSLERLPYGHYAVGTYVKPDVISNYRLMQEDIYWEHCIFLVRKNSVLLPLLDNLILRVFEAGLAAYWENKVVAQHMDMSVQRAITYYTHSVKEHEIVELKWFHVEGAFAVLILGYAISSLIFLIEILAKSEMRRI